jgi:molecular chaperone HscB
MRIDYFKEFGLSRSFVIDLDQLEESYLAQQLKFHPDKYINADSDTKRKSLEKTIDINKAYDTLKFDLSRALYLLELEGILLNAEGGLVDFPELLSTVFEERDSLNMAKSQEELIILHERSEKDLAEYKQEFSKHYKEKNFSEASIVYKKMLYKTKIIEEIKTKLNG